jgi:hypothetical protein
VAPGLLKVRPECSRPKMGAEKPNGLAHPGHLVAKPGACSVRKRRCWLVERVFLRR